MKRVESRKAMRESEALPTKDSISTWFVDPMLLANSSLRDILSLSTPIHH